MTSTQRADHKRAFDEAVKHHEEGEKMCTIASTVVPFFYWCGCPNTGQIIYGQGKGTRNNPWVYSHEHCPAMATSAKPTPLSDERLSDDRSPAEERRHPHEEGGVTSDHVYR